MAVEIVTIGNELLNGDLADTNTQRLATLLRELGLQVARAQTVPDTIAAIVEALRAASERATIVLVSGGLGPTEDDLTLEAAAAAARVTLIEHTPTVERLKARFASRGFPLTPNNLRQAQVPVGADVFDNPVGTAPHVQLAIGRARFFFFPGVPSELQRLADDYLRPWLVANAPVRRYESRTFKTFGKTESQVATSLAALPRDPKLHVAYRAHFPEIQVSLHVEDDHDLLERSATFVRETLGDILYGEDKHDTLAGVVGRLLKDRGETVATAESCTGGLVAKLLTDRDGSSAYLKEGFVTYSNEAKTARIGVDSSLLEAHGAVSEAVARAMAEGAKKAAGTDWAVSITGVAGPGGGSEGKPVGTVHFAVAGPSGTVHLHRKFPFDRDKNRVVSAMTALDLLRRGLLEKQD